ncbi:MAG: pyridoxal-phosphate dependent enzyme [Gammaproteobacteria bacterium]|nr:pyridoxal-phosphate dependent enzyme [Gammaproteobacteria bacterium]
MRPLFARFPTLADRLPFLSLATLPTPVDSEPAFAAQLGIADLLIKRDDLSASVYGGNKVRKLEHLLADAQNHSADAVLTFGATGSNHILATSIYARQVGLDCYGVMVEQPASPKVAATLRYHALLGTHLALTAGMKGIADTTAAIKAAHPTGAGKVYEVPWGGSSWLGVTGFINAALELANQIAVPPDRIYVANGTMGTSVGLAIGCQLLGWPTKIVGVRVSPLKAITPQFGDRMFTDTVAELHALDPDFPLLDEPQANVNLREGFLGKGYAVPTEATHEAVAMGAAELGMQLDTTYTGKAMAALISDARAGKLRDQRVVFWQTYNSRPYPPDLDTVNCDALPAEFQPFV